MKLKFNGGKRALLWDNCGVILATGSRIPDVFKNTTEHLYFCSKECRTQFIDKISNIVDPENGSRKYKED